MEISRHGMEFRHVCMLYRRGDYHQALEAADRAVARGYSLAGAERDFVLAELDKDVARAGAAVEQAIDHPEESRFSTFGAMCALFFLGKTQAATQLSAKIRQQPAGVPQWRGDWYRNQLQYVGGRITEDDLLKVAASARQWLCEAHFLIGLRHLSEGDRVGARKHFQNCSDTRVFIYWDYIWARAFLARLEKDPTWPKWIPLKEQDGKSARPKRE
jgi:hypothetical protein